MDKLEKAIMETYDAKILTESTNSWLARLHSSFDEEGFERNILAKVLGAVKSVDGQVPDEKAVRSAILDAVNASIDNLLVDWDKKYVKGK